MVEKRSFGDNLRVLRQTKGLSQTEFAEFLDITQPSLSAYEKGRTAPTMEVLISIAEKCNISLDWLCGLSTSAYSIGTVSDIADFLFKLKEIKEIEAVIEVIANVDKPNETDRNIASIAFDGNDYRYERNLSVFSVIREINDLYNDLESFAISKEMYDMAKEQRIEYYSRFPLTQKEFPVLSRDKRLEYHRDYMDKQRLKD